MLHLLAELPVPVFARQQPPTRDLSTETIDDGWALAGEAPTRPLPLNVNTATVDQLHGLPGVGPLRARRIIAIRERRGGFSSLDDLTAVKGVGPKMVEMLRPHLIVR